MSDLEKRVNKAVIDWRVTCDVTSGEGLVAIIKELSAENEQLRAGVFGFNGMARDFEEREKKLVWLVKIVKDTLEYLKEHYPNPEISHVDYRVVVCRMAGEDLEDIEAILRELGIEEK